MLKAHPTFIFTQFFEIQDGADQVKVWWSVISREFPHSQMCFNNLCTNKFVLQVWIMQSMNLLTLSRCWVMRKMTVESDLDQTSFHHQNFANSVNNGKIIWIGNGIQLAIYLLSPHEWSKAGAYHVVKNLTFFQLIINLIWWWCRWSWHVMPPTYSLNQKISFISLYVSIEFCELIDFLKSCIHGNWYVNWKIALPLVNWFFKNFVLHASILG